MTYVERITDAEYAELQRRFGGRYVARQGAEVITSATSLGQLIHCADAMTIDWVDVVIQYVDRADRVRAY